MVSGTVEDLPSFLYSLYNLEFEPSAPTQLDILSRNDEGDWEFDSKFDVNYRAVVSLGLGPAHPINGVGKARAVGRAAGSDSPFEPLEFQTELVALDLFDASSNPDVIIRESPTLRSSGVTVVEDLCPLCFGPLPMLRISSFFGIFTEKSLIGGDWSPASDAIRAVQYPTPTTPGDYNANGVVDAADYVVWRNNMHNGFSLPNDDSPGVGADDYARWRANYGTAAKMGSASAVPEPGTLLIVTLVACVAAMHRPTLTPIAQQRTGART